MKNVRGVLISVEWIQQSWLVEVMIQKVKITVLLTSPTEQCLAMAVLIHYISFSQTLVHKSEEFDMYDRKKGKHLLR